MLRIVGLVLVVAGLSVLGWLGWQYWGTNWQSQQRHDDVTETLEKTWTSGQATAETDFGEATAILRIPRFGDDWSVPVLNGDSDGVLGSGVGTSTAPPTRASGATSRSPATGSPTASRSPASAACAPATR